MKMFIAYVDDLPPVLESLHILSNILGHNFWYRGMLNNWLLIVWHDTIRLYRNVRYTRV
jgi:hypothetical protein